MPLAGYNDVILAEGPNSEPLTTFRGRTLPTAAYLVGYSALIAAFDLQVPLNHEMAAIAPKNTRRKEDGWAIYPVTMRPQGRIIDHLIFALKHEGVVLLILKLVFEKIDKDLLVSALEEKPTSTYVRRLCYLYEWLLEDDLELRSTVAGAYVNVIDINQQYATAIGPNYRKYRIRDNLPGPNTFCPLVFKTRKIEDYIRNDLSARAKRIVAGAPKELIARAAAFLLLSDSKASFAIEGENPPKDRIARWGSVIGKAGQIELAPEQLVALQRDLIGDDRFIKVGWRYEGGFVGRHDAMGQPAPEHISAKAQDLESLINGLCSFEHYGKIYKYHPVLTAATISFGFVYIHPFEDGNGRIHRFLMHHVLAQRGFTPHEIVFPISSVILDDIARYKDVLESVSKELLDFIQWRPTEGGNVNVTSNTADYYKYFNATAHCEYLFKCIERAVERDLPEELSFLQHRDNFHRSVTNIVDMGERKLDLLLKFLRQNYGSLSNRAKTKEYNLLTIDEVRQIEQIYSELFLENLMIR